MSTSSPKRGLSVNDESEGSKEAKDKTEPPEVLVSQSEVSKRVLGSKGRTPKRKQMQAEAEPGEPPRKVAKFKTVSSFGSQETRTSDTAAQVDGEKIDEQVDSKAESETQSNVEQTGQETEKLAAVEEHKPENENTSIQVEPVEDVKVCDICGDTGFEEMLAVCTRCNEGAEHIYCMETPLVELPVDWLCYGCRKGKAGKTIEQVRKTMTREGRIKSGVRFSNRNKAATSLGSQLRNKAPLAQARKGPDEPSSGNVVRDSNSQSGRQPSRQLESENKGLASNGGARPKESSPKTPESGKSRLFPPTTPKPGGTSVRPVQAKANVDAKPPRGGIPSAPRPPGSKGPYSFLLDAGKQGKGLKLLSEAKDVNRLLPSKGARPDTPRPTTMQNVKEATGVTGSPRQKVKGFEGAAFQSKVNGLSSELKGAVEVETSEKAKQSEETVPVTEPVVVPNDHVEKVNPSAKAILGQVLDLPVVSDPLDKSISEGPRADTFPLDQVATANMPSTVVSWRGRFELVANTGSSIQDNIQARVSDHASPKVLEATKLLPASLKLQEYQRISSWPKKFFNISPTGQDIALYFFPSDDESRQKVYNELVERMVKYDLVLKCALEGAELLLTPSSVLPDFVRYWRGREFLWGVFQGKKAAAIARAVSPQPEATTTFNMNMPALNSPALGPSGTETQQQMPKGSTEDIKDTKGPSTATNLEPSSTDAIGKIRGSNASGARRAFEAAEAGTAKSGSPRCQGTGGTAGTTAEGIPIPPGFENYVKQVLKPEATEPKDVKVAENAPANEETVKRDRSKEDKEGRRVKDSKKLDREKERDKERKEKPERERERERRDRDRERDRERDSERDRRDRDRAREKERDRSYKERDKYSDKSRRRHRSRSRSLSPPRKRHRSPSYSPPRKRTKSPASPRKRSRSRSPRRGKTYSRQYSKSSTDSLDSHEEQRQRKEHPTDRPITDTSAATDQATTGTAAYHNFLLGDDEERRSIEKDLFPVSGRAMNSESTEQSSADLMDISRGFDLELAPAAEDHVPGEEHTPLTLSLAVPRYRKAGNSWVKVGDSAKLGADDVNFALTL